MAESHAKVVDARKAMLDGGYQQRAEA